MINTQTDLRSSLSGATFPSSKAELIDHAADNGASMDVLMTLGSVVDGLYLGVADILQELEESTYNDEIDDEDDE